MSGSRGGTHIALIRRHGWDLVAIATIAVTFLLHVRFMVLDDRAPTDLGHYYSVFQRLVQYWHLQHKIDFATLDTPYTLLLTGLSMPFGPSVGLMEVVDGVWLLILVAGVWTVARSVAGPLAGAVSALCVAGYPQTPVIARTHWIHHPETAAIVGTLALWVSSPGIGSWWRAFAIAILLFFGETIRQTGIPFGVPLALFVLVGGWRAGARAKLAPILLAFIGGVAWYAPVLAKYIQHKSQSAAGYAQSVHKPWLLFVEGMSLPIFALSLPFVLLGVLALRRRDRASGIVALCLVWIAGAAASVGIFHVGADNFPIAGTAWALLAGIGLAGAPSWKWLPVRAGGFAIIALAAIFIQGTALLSAPWVRPLQAVIGPWGSAGPINYLRVYWNPMAVAQVLPLVEKACAETRSVPGAQCVIVASRGLFNPSWEDGGSFGLFLAGMDYVNVMTPQILWDGEGRLVSGGKLVRAIVDVTCSSELIPNAGGRFGQQNARMRELLRPYANAKPDGVIGDPHVCEQSWYIIPAGVKVVQ